MIFSSPGVAERRRAVRNRPGAATRSRTLDLLITSELLYRLSYGGIVARSLTSQIRRNILSNGSLVSLLNRSVTSVIVNDFLFLLGDLWYFRVHSP